MEPERSEPSAPLPDEVAIRGADSSDMGFVADSWRRSYERRGWPGCPGGVPEYIATQGAVIAACLASSDVLVACLGARPEQILGWLCGRPGVVHYVYVKPYYRRHGIGLRLLRTMVGTQTRVFCSHHIGHMGQGITAIVAQARQRGISVECNPALIFGGQRT